MREVIGKRTNSPSVNFTLGYREVSTALAREAKLPFPMCSNLKALVSLCLSILLATIRTLVHPLPRCGAVSCARKSAQFKISTT